MTIGETVSRRRKDRGWTQEDLAAVADMPRNHISAIETGRLTDPRASTLEKLASALNMSVDELVTGDDLQNAASADVTGVARTPTRQHEQTDGLALDYRQTTGWRVKVLRTDRGLTQKELGERVGVATSTISGIERNAQGLSQLADRLAGALGTTTDYLLGRSDAPNPPAARQPEDDITQLILSEAGRLGAVDRRALYEIALTLRLASERRRHGGD